jgi:hypothetical protein
LSVFVPLFAIECAQKVTRSAAMPISDDPTACTARCDPDLMDGTRS